MIFLKLSQRKAQLLTFLILLVSTSLLSFQSQAVHMSAFRIYLDDNQRQSTFTLSNSETLSQECNLFLRHYNYDDDGKIIKYKDDTLPENSAKNWMRFSPKHFVLTPKNSQKVRFSMRRKAKAKSAEYRSFLVVDCGVENKESKKELINIKPKLIHNVPIIVRVGKLKVDVAFSDIKITDDTLRYKLTREGTRSIYGDVELIDKRTDKKITYQKGLSLYPESSYYKLSFGTRGIDPKYLQLKFIEATQFGGDKVIVQDLQP